MGKDDSVMYIAYKHSLVLFIYIFIFIFFFEKYVILFILG